MTDASQPVAKEMAVEECLRVVQTGDFDQLLGAVESETIEFKGSPYVLSSTRDKVELAKDISGLANAGGGILLMGIGTSVLEGHPREAATRIRPFEEKMVDIKQYEDVLSQWIYPKLHAEINWFPSGSREGKGLACIQVAETQAGRKPFLTVGVLQENEKILGNVVGFFQRRGDKVANWSPEELQHVFKDGLRFDDHLAEINQTLGKMLSGAKATQPKGIASEALDQRIENAIEAVGLTDSCCYVLASWPDEQLEIRGLFESRTSDIVKLIDDPPELRYAGFDISTEERSKIVNGEFRRSIVKSYKVLEVWRDGTLIFVTTGDEGFLCWGNYNSNEFLGVNSIALVESVYLYTLFVRSLHEKADVVECPGTMCLKLKNIPAGKPYVLPLYPPGSFGLPRGEPLVGSAPGREIVVQKEFRWSRVTPERLAYEIVGDVYAKFGYEYERVPYTKDENGVKSIDPEKLKAIR